jgi:DNA-binding response OmpR family regulator
MKRVLIIEDDQIVANIYRNKFASDGFEAEIALDGHAGLDLVRKFKPDAVVLDLMLPKLTGVEVMKKIRSESALQQLPIIVLSNTYLTEMVQEAWKAGATKCVSKSSATPKQIIEMLRSTLGINGPAAPAAAATPPPARPLTRPPEPAPGQSDAEFQAGLRKTFIEGLPATLAALRARLQGLAKAEPEAARLKQLQDLYRRIHALTGNAGLAGFLPISQMADALEVLLKELHEKPKNITPSTLRTVASAIDFLGMLFDRASLDQPQEMPPGNVLVVDDEAISRRAITYALEKAKLKSTSVEDPHAAYKMLAETKFDLIFLDVDMPGMNGFELCTKLRALQAHKKTPVVFVTSLNDFESRANSTMSGGNDFIAKPFLFIELAVKALVYVLRGRIETAK